MPLFKLVYKADGVDRTEYVDAPNSELAIKFKNALKRTVISCNRDVLEEVKRTFANKPVSADQQALIIQTVANALSSGRSTKDTIKDILAENFISNYDRYAVDRAESLPEYFKAFNFDKVAVTAAQAGEKSNSVLALKETVNFLQRSAQDKKEFGSKVAMGFVYLFLGIAFLLLAPLLIGSQLDKMLNELNINLRINFASHYLLFMNDFIRSYYWIFLLAILPIAYYKDALFEQLKSLPIIADFHEIGAIKRSITFVSNLSILTSSGATSAEVAQILFESSTGRDRAVYHQLMNDLDRGKSIYQACGKDEWPATFRISFKGYDTTNASDRPSLYKSAMSTLYVNLSTKTASMTSKVSFIGAMACVAAIFMIALGHFVPMMGITSALRM